MLPACYSIKSIKPINYQTQTKCHQRKKEKKGSHLGEFFHDVGYFNTSDTPTGNEEDTEDVIGGGMISRRRAVVGRDKWARRFARQTEWVRVCDVTD